MSTMRTDLFDDHSMGYVAKRKASYLFLFAGLKSALSSSTFQSSEGSFTNTSMVLSSRSGSSLKARSECTITLWMRPDSPMGRIKFINCRVILNGISSGTGRNYKQQSYSQAVYQSFISKLVQ